MDHLPVADVDADVVVRRATVSEEDEVAGLGLGQGSSYRCCTATGFRAPCRRRSAWAMRVRPENSLADRPSPPQMWGFAELRVGVVEHLLLVAAHRRLGRCGWRRRCGRRRRRGRVAGVVGAVGLVARAFLAASAAAASPRLPQHRAPPDRRPLGRCFPSSGFACCSSAWPRRPRPPDQRPPSRPLRQRPRGGGLASRLLGRGLARGRPGEPARPPPRSGAAWPGC